MKKYLLILILFSACTKEQTEQKHFGVIGNIDQQFRKPARPPKGRKDTTTVPVDTTTIPTDTTVIPPVQDTTVILPASYSLVMPPVLNQGSEGSCVAFSVSYARGSMEYYSTGNLVSLSPEFLFNQTTNDHNSCSGSAIITASDFLKTNGVCALASMPYSWQNGCSLMPTEAQKTEALQYRISSYELISASDIKGIKTALLSNHALVIQVAADNNFSNATQGFIWKSSGQVIGYHSLVVCGYDDSKHAYKVENSWGVNWCDSGYGWIDYDLFPKVSSSLIKYNK